MSDKESMKASFLTNYDEFLKNTEMSSVPPFPARIMLEVTNNCNHRCVFCAHKHMVREKQNIDPDLCVRLLRRAYALGARECAFHGGSEPFMHPGLHKMVRSAKDAGYTYTYLTTNGAACSKERLLRVLEAGLDSIKFSINAGTAENYTLVHGTDAFGKALDMLQLAAEYRARSNADLKVYVSVITCSLNQDTVGQLHALTDGLVDSIEYLPAAWLGKRTDIPFEELKPLFPGKAACMEPFNRFTVTTEGLIRACCNDADNFLVMGDARAEDLEAIWAGERFRRLRQWHLERTLPEHCLCHGCLLYADTRALPFETL